VEIYNKALIDKHVSDAFAILIGLKQDDLSQVVFTSSLEYAIKESKKIRKVWN
jgi:hypothetical protein